MGGKKKEHFKRAAFFFKPRVKIICIHKCIDQWFPNFVAGSKAIRQLLRYLK